MQHLEVSDAVRPIYGSLGVKRLMKLKFSRHTFEKIQTLNLIKIHPVGEKFLLRTDGHRRRQT
jgi:hypothetical protein